MPFSPLNLLSVAVAFGLALALTPIVRAFARRIGLVAKPKTDRWHKKPTAMLGGLAIWLSVVIPYLLFFRPDKLFGFDSANPSVSYSWVIISASAFLFLVGLVDDLIHTKPYQKLIGQIMGSAFVIYYGLTLPWTGSQSLNVVLTIFWLIGITNALNLLDNMDGLAAGIAVIGSAFLALNFIATGQLTEALMMMTFAGAILGFL
ncbi:MAG: undecaprenyl/decaprenyl-phosphate alpha-N-acetylglucosaminyl 1-phosphate transferase, partial [Acidobacteriota bacterium]|nr:undecaprenyl/decaprenyl-phosphate alpha-N-acetylglucosaminyl 1-phosphate transferase [Acidobacteriota bacterium]